MYIELARAEPDNNGPDLEAPLRPFEEVYILIDRVLAPRCEQLFIRNLIRSIRALENSYIEELAEFLVVNEQIDNTKNMLLDLIKYVELAMTQTIDSGEAVSGFERHRDKFFASLKQYQSSIQQHFHITTLEEGFRCELYAQYFQSFFLILYGSYCMFGIFSIFLDFDKTLRDIMNAILATMCVILVVCIPPYVSLNNLQNTISVEPDHVKKGIRAYDMMHELFLKHTQASIDSFRYV